MSVVSDLVRAGDCPGTTCLDGLVATSTGREFASWRCCSMACRRATARAHPSRTAFVTASSSSSALPGESGTAESPWGDGEEGEEGEVVVGVAVLVTVLGVMVVAGVGVVIPGLTVWGVRVD